VRYFYEIRSSYSLSHGVKKEKRRKKKRETLRSIIILYYFLPFVNTLGEFLPLSKIIDFFQYLCYYLINKQGLTPQAVYLSACGHAQAGEVNH
jgi:hypothetical protein